MASPVEADLDRRLRATAMAWLDVRCTDDDPLVKRSELLEFRFDDRRIPLVDQSRGIRRPQNFPAAISILTTYTPSTRTAPYEDSVGPDGLLRYKYRGSDPMQGDNVAVRDAYRLQTPLIWFYGVAEGLYLPRYPVWIVGEERERLQFVVAVDEAQLSLAKVASSDPARRRYAERMTRQRLHQPVFRQQVIHAYGGSCAMCRLRHISLLDAAHIRADVHPRGIPAVSNGLSLCKIHHAAYDNNILGIRPDCVIQVRGDVLEEVDGPMLKHGLQAMQGVSLTVPQRRSDWPDRQAIEERYNAFLETA